MTEKEFIKQLKQAGLLTADGQVNYRNYNIEHPIKDINSNDYQKIRNATRILCEMIKVGRKPALYILFAAIEDNKDDFKHLEIIAENLEVIDNDEYIDFIFDFLEKTKSNATSRIFIRNLIEWMIRYNNNEKVIERLDKLAKDKNFSYKMKKHFKHAKEDVQGISTFSFYEDHYY